MPEMDPLFSLKGEARQLQQLSRSTAHPLTHSQALEQVARRHGFDDWNACTSAHAKAPAQRRQVATPGRPLPTPQDPPEYFMLAADSPLARSIWFLRSWVALLQDLAIYRKPSSSYPQKFAGIERKPYMFEKNLQRWPDGKFHLVDRGYQEVKGVVLTEQELKDLGVVGWYETKYCSVDAGDSYTLMDDAFPSRADPQGLELLAGVMARVASHVERR